MKVNFFLASLIAGLTSSLLPAQEGTPHPDRTSQHAVLDAFTGDWTVTGQLFLGGTELQPLDMKGSEKARWMPGLLWVEVESQGNLGGALPFVGRSLWGFDIGKKKYVQTGVTSLSSPRLTIAEGSYDPNTKTLTTFDTTFESGSRTPSEVKLERTLIDPNSQVLLVSTKRNGDWIKTLELRYTRKKP